MHTANVCTAMYAVVCRNPIANSDEKPNKLAVTTNYTLSLHLRVES